MANRITVKVIVSDSRHNYLTDINGTIEDARRYFVGQELNVGTVDDLMVKCLKVEDATDWKLFQVTFNGRTKNALGVTYKITDSVWAPDEEGVRLALYDKYEHVTGVRDIMDVTYTVRKREVGNNDSV